MTPPHLQDKQEVASLETDQAKLGSAGDNALFFFSGGGRGGVGQKKRGDFTNFLKK